VVGAPAVKTKRELGKNGGKQGAQTDERREQSSRTVKHDGKTAKSL